MGASRPRHWLLAAVILSLSSSLMASEVQRFTSSDSSVIDDLRRDETNRTRVMVIRRRRYVRFPTGSAAYVHESGSGLHGRNLGPHPIARFVPQAQFSGSWRQHKSLWRNPAIADYNRPVMSHRTPRLIFRDNDFLPPAGGGAASFFQQSNQLPDFEDDIRDLRKQTPDDYPRLETVDDFRRGPRHGNRYDISDVALCRRTVDRSHAELVRGPSTIAQMFLSRKSVGETINITMSMLVLSFVLYSFLFCT